MFGKRCLSFHARALLSVGRSCIVAKHAGFRSFLSFGSTCWEEVILFSPKSFAFSSSKPHHCQTRWFQRLFGLAHHVWEEVTLSSCKSSSFIWSKPHCLQTRWSRSFFVIMFGKRCLSFHARALLSVGRSRAIARHAGFRGFLVWLFMLGKGDSLFMQELCFQ